MTTGNICIRTGRKSRHNNHKPQSNVQLKRILLFLVNGRPDKHVFYRVF